jgi:predicted GH43/DUF377 family glycosyl hydrolase
MALKRYEQPVIKPGDGPDEVDYLGVEDPRITRIGDTFYVLYCGLPDTYLATICLARSYDLLEWEKLGPVKGDINYMDNWDFEHSLIRRYGWIRTNPGSRIPNKDGVLFPEPVDGNYLLLHRPMTGGALSDYVTHLAISDSPTGEWKDCGEILRANPCHPHAIDAWTGAGSVPMPLGDKRFLMIFHTGIMLAEMRREYVLDVAMLNFQDFDPRHPERIVQGRVDRLMVPETKWEIDSPFPNSVGHVLFACGSYEYQGYIYIVYGGGDTYTMAARINKAALLNLLKEDVIRCLVSVVDRDVSHN